MTIREGVAFQTEGLQASDAIIQWQDKFEAQTKACYQQLLAQREEQRLYREGTLSHPTSSTSSSSTTLHLVH